MTTPRLPLRRSPPERDVGRDGARDVERVRVVPDEPQGVARGAWRPGPDAAVPSHQPSAGAAPVAAPAGGGAMLGPAWTRELIAEVARRHQVLLTPDDPIFLTVTLHERTVGRMVEEVEARVGALLDEATTGLVVAAEEQREAARASAEALVTGAARYLVEQAERAGDELALRLHEALQADVAAAREAAIEARAARDDARRIWRATVAVLGVALVLLVCWVVLLLGS